MRGLSFLGRLFPDSARPATTRVGVGLAILAVLAGAVISLLRTSGTGPLQSTWEEDARDVLSAALNQPGLRTLFQPTAGYFIVLPRMLGLLAAQFPISWAAAVLSISAALITALLAVQVYVASGAHLNSTLARLLVSAPLLAAPVAENALSEISNRPVGLHFFATYALFWLFLWTPATRWGKAGLFVTIGLTAISTILIVAWVPLAVLRAVVRRNALSVWMMVVTLAGTAMQLASVASGVTGRGDAGPRLDPLWAVGTYVTWAVPRSLLGYRATIPLNEQYGQDGAGVADHLVIIGLGWLVVLVVVLVAIVGGRLGWLRPNWLMASVAAITSLWLNVMMVMSNGGFTERYLPPVELLLFSALVLLLLPAKLPSRLPGKHSGKLSGKVSWRKAYAPLAAFAVLILVVVAFNYRWNDTYRHRAPVWTQQVKQAGNDCRLHPDRAFVVVRGGPQPFWSIVKVPCHLLRQDNPCLEPECRYLDLPQSIGPPRQVDARLGDLTATS